MFLQAYFLHEVHLHVHVGLVLLHVQQYSEAFLVVVECQVIFIQSCPVKTVCQSATDLMLSQILPVSSKASTTARIHPTWASRNAGDPLSRSPSHDTGMRLAWHKNRLKFPNIPCGMILQAIILSN